MIAEKARDGFCGDPTGVLRFVKAIRGFFNGVIAGGGFYRVVDGKKILHEWDDLLRFTSFGFYHTSNKDLIITQLDKKSKQFKWSGWFTGRFSGPWVQQLWPPTLGFYVLWHSKPLQHHRYLVSFGTGKKKNWYCSRIHTTNQKTKDESAKKRKRKMCCRL